VDVVRVARQPAAALDRVASPGQDRDAVERLLAAPDRAVAGVADRTDRKGLVRRLQLLQADDVGLRLGEPFEQAAAAGS
jgi:hypothetical protein